MDYIIRNYQPEITVNQYYIYACIVYIIDIQIQYENN